MKPLIVSVVFLLGGAFAQTPEPALVFDAASVRFSTAAPTVMLTKGGPGTLDPGRIDYTNVPMRTLLRLAYGVVRNYELSAPNWMMGMADERYDVVANLPPGTTREQFMLMLQNLLADRFKIAAHYESREIQGYALVVGKGGPKFKETAVKAPAPLNPEERKPLKGEKDRDGLPQLASGQKGMPMFGLPNGGTRYSARQEPMSLLGSVLQELLGKPVVDETGLTAEYDFNLTYLRDARSSANVSGDLSAANVAAAADQPDAPQDLFTALQDQLGLKLEPKRTQVNVLVVDRGEKVPKEN
jgi:uncharacterized protein (TIGR03435 family)